MSRSKWQYGSRLIAWVVFLSFMSISLGPPPVLHSILSPPLSRPARADPGQPDSPLEQEQAFTKYFSYENMVIDLTEMAHNNAGIMKIDTIGETYEHRDIVLVKISDNVDIDEEDEPNVQLIGMHHSREWMSLEVPMYLIHWLIDSYNDPDCANHSRAAWIIANRQLYIVPIMNVDGFVYDGDGDLEIRNNWRKDREPNYVMGKLVSYGTDPNRNYQWKWGKEFGDDNRQLPGSSFSPSSSTYRGPNDDYDDDGDSLLGIDLGDPLFRQRDLDRVDEDPVDGLDNDGDHKVDEDPDGGFSAMETRAVRDMFLNIDPVFSICWHSYSDLVLYPWGCDPEPPVDEDLYVFTNVGGAMADATGYTLTQSYELYRTTGDSDDWFYGISITDPEQPTCYPFTIEIGSSEDGGFYPPEKSILPMAAKNLEPPLLLAEYADSPHMRYLRIDTEPLGNTSDTGPFDVACTVSDPTGQAGGIRTGQEGDDVFLHYRVGGGEWRSVRMNGEGGEYHGSIPAVGSGSRVSYYIEAVGKLGVSNTQPKYVPFGPFTFTVGSGNGLASGGVITTILFMILFFLIIWGGFGAMVSKAFRSLTPDEERRILEQKSAVEGTG